MKQIKTFLFDLDGTLIMSWPFIMASFDHVLSHFKLPKEGLLHPCMRHCTLHYAYTHLGLDDHIEQAKKLHIEFQNNNLHLLETFPASKAVLENLRARKMNVGIISNRFKNGPDLLKHCGLFDYVDLIIGAENVSQTKPHPEGILSAMDHFSTEERETVMVGDTVIDIQAGKRAGVWTIAIDGSECLDELQREKPDLILKNLEDLLSLFLI